MMTEKFAVGQEVSCKYPQHGRRNILCRQEGEVVTAGGNFITIKRADGSFRSLRFARMVDIHILEEV
jgi:hypothetical protein